MVEMRFINYGCFRQFFSRPWLNVDILELEPIVPDGYDFMRMDVTRRHPFRNDQFEMAYSSHLVEHLPLDRCLYFLQEVHRTLRPGCWFRVATPDLEVFLRALKERDMDRFATAQPEAFSAFRSQEMKFSLIVFGNLGSDPQRYTGHWNCFSESSLKELLELAGFSEVVRTDAKSSNDERFFESGGYDMWVEGSDAHTLILEAKKD